MSIERMSPEDRLALNEEAGWEVIKVLQALKPLPDWAWAFHRRVAQALHDSGFYVEVEHGTARYGDERYGRIDVFAARAGGHVAIELDTRKPRNRSVAKLDLFPGFRLIVLRGEEWEGELDGIHVLTLPIRRATKAEKASRRSWRPFEVAA